MSNIVRYSPINELRRMRWTIDRLMDAAFADEPWDPFASFGSIDPFRPLSFGFPGEFFPGDNLAVDLYEKGDKLVLKASLPGVDRDDVEVEEHGGLLSIRARTQADEERQANGWHLRQHRSSFWQRTIRLPMEIDVNRAQAELEDGVLTVTLPKREPNKSLVNRIKVNLPKIKLPGISKKEGKIHISHN